MFEPFRERHGDRAGPDRRASGASSPSAATALLNCSCDNFRACPAPAKDIHAQGHTIAYFSDASAERGFRDPGFKVFLWGTKAAALSLCSKFVKPSFRMLLSRPQVSPKKAPAWTRHTQHIHFVIKLNKPIWLGIVKLVHRTVL